MTRSMSETRLRPEPRTRRSTKDQPSARVSIRYRKTGFLATAGSFQSVSVPNLAPGARADPGAERACAPGHAGALDGPARLSV
ncbi:hypothetical protein GCM10009853_078690 [Glycomyces scopariae]